MAFDESKPKLFIAQQAIDERKKIELKQRISDQLLELDSLSGKVNIKNMLQN